MRLPAHDEMTPLLFLRMTCVSLKRKDNGFPIHLEACRGILIVSKRYGDWNIFTVHPPCIESLELVAECMHVNAHFIQNRVFESEEWF